jgi:hypothetical protein
MPAFVDGLDRVKWFAHLFEPLEEPGASAFPDWAAWPGPVDPRVSEIHFRQQELYDALLATSERPEELKALFDVVVARVIQLARSSVPFDEKEDAWHAPTTAVWHAAWTAGLIALYETRQLPADPEVAAQWRWFERGRWPAAAFSFDRNGAPIGFVVM